MFEILTSLSVSNELDTDVIDLSEEHIDLSLIRDLMQEVETRTQTSPKFENSYRSDTTGWGVSHTEARPGNTTYTRPSDHERQHNSQNPYNFVGVDHNNLLDLWISQSPRATYSEFIRLSSDYLSPNFDGADRYFTGNVQGEFVDWCKFILSDPLNGYDIDALVYNNPALSHTQQAFYVRLAQPAYLRSESFFLRIQDEVLRSAMTEREKVPILASIAVGLNSIQYWSSVNSNPIHPWYPGNGGSLFFNTGHDRADRDFDAFILISLVSIYFYYSASDGVEEQMFWSLLAFTMFVSAVYSHG